MLLNEFKEKINGKHVTVVGIGISNVPLIDFLLKCGAEITARDKKTPEQMGDIYASLKEKGVRLICGEEYLDNIEEKIIFKAPGIRDDIEPFAKAKKQGAVITSEMELFFELCPCKKIAVTGSDGKTTTTTLISLILKKQKELYGEEYNVWTGGNIGVPLIGHIEEITSNDIAVLELSSFQLHRMKRSPEVCVVTNISPNHLNWHTDMQEYIDSKTNIFLHQTKDGKTVLNYGCDITRDFSKVTPGKAVFFNSDGNGVYLKDGIIYFDGEKIISKSDIKLPGKHNVENYMAAIAALYGTVSKEAIKEVANNFGGVEHRIEFVRELDGVKYYNSSIDTSPTRTMAALSAFEQKLIVILGGYDKHIPYEPLIDPLFDKVKVAILTGDTAEKMHSLIINSERYGKDELQVYKEEKFEDAVRLAKEKARRGDVVILSPAAASFDKFVNFEARGVAFKDIVNKF